MNNFVLHPQLAADSRLIRELPLCQVRLINDRQYPWFLLVPRVADARDIIDLSWPQQRQLWHESAWLSETLRSEYQPKKLNVAALGNMVPQLHLHHIARFENDLSWPSPVWGKFPAIAYTEQQYMQIFDRWSDFIYTPE